MSCVTCSRRSERLGVAARARTKARIVAVTGSVGKTSTKEALRLVLTQGGAAHASVASYNNHWGVPLTLARMPKRRELRRLRNRHEPCAAKSRRCPRWCGRMSRSSPQSRRCISRISPASRPSPTPRRRFSPASCRAASRSSTRQSRISSGFARRAQASPAGHVASFGEHANADARLLEREAGATIIRSSTAQICGRALTYRLGAPGRHLAMNSLAVLLAAQGFRRRSRGRRGRAGLFRRASRARPDAALAAPRGSFHADRRKLQRQSGLDAGGFRARRRIARAGARTPHRRARRHAGTRRHAAPRCTPNSPPISLPTTSISSSRPAR